MYKVNVLQVMRRVPVTRDFKTIFKYSSTKHLATLTIRKRTKNPIQLKTVFGCENLREFYALYARLSRKSQK